MGGGDCRHFPKPKGTMQKIKGPPLVCFRDFFGKLPEDVQVKVIKFFGLTAETVRGWMSESSSGPNGFSLLRLRDLLEVFGYTVTSSNLNSASETKSFGRLISFRVITVDEAMALTQYVKTCTLLDVLFGKYGVSNDRLSRMAHEVKRHQTALDYVVKEVVEVFGRIESSSVLPSPSLVAEVQSPTVSSSGEVEQAIMESFHRQVKALLPVALFLLSSKSSRELRIQMRRIFNGGFELHELSDAINALLSEETRERWLRSQQQHGGKKV